jgi:2-keto-4-pentenoate hydratase/2-oxohepta-3-ene-1,7-dioic acid hydratase in catechol pathway
MKLVRFFYKKSVKYGVIEDRFVRVIEKGPSQKILLGKIKILPPSEPTKIVLVGLNYKDHAKELKMKLPKEPIIFLKPNTSVIAHKEAIVYPQGVRRLDYEAELAIVIGRECKNIKEKEARKYIFGYTCLNDVTGRDLQKKDTQWTRAKSFDSFCPLGPYLETEIDSEALKIRSYLNGKLKQNSSTENLIFSVEYLVSFISKIMRLLPGDVISTGTPPGVGPMQKGDIVEIEIEGIGRLKNNVI